MIDIIYLFAALAIAAPIILGVMYVDYLKFKKWFEQQQEPEPFKYEEPVRISKRQSEIFNRSMRRINKELKDATVVR
jgi:hypothetical protein